MKQINQKPKYYLSPSLLNCWIKGYDIVETIKREPKEETDLMRDGIEFERQAIEGEIKELKPIVEDCLYQQFLCKECEGYMLLGFADCIKKDTIYDFKFVKSYDLGKYNDSVQHLIYLYCADMDKFEYVIGCGKRDREIFFEKQPRNDELLRTKIRQFSNWLNVVGLREEYEKNYSIERYKEQIENYLNW